MFNEIEKKMNEFIKNNKDQVKNLYDSESHKEHFKKNETNLHIFSIMMDGMTLSDICYIMGRLIIQIDKENPEEVLKDFIKGVTLAAECSLAVRNKKIQNLIKEVASKE